MKKLFISFLAISVLGGCANPAPKAPVIVGPVIVGNDRDAHGCIGSAGYKWSAQSKSCVRPWEENAPATPIPPK